MKIGLPRKRKKIYIKKHGAGGYLAMRIVNQLLIDEGKKNYARFPRTYNEIKTKPTSFY